MLKELLVNDDHMPELYEYDEKPLEAGRVRVRSLFGAPKHGSELTGFQYHPFRGQRYDEQAHIFKKSDETPPQGRERLGNIFVGTVTGIGNGVEGFTVGERVAGYGHLASTHTVKADELLKMPERMTWQEAVCYDPMQFAMGGLRDAHVRLGDAVLVSGLGAIGQMAAQAAKVAGASFVAVSDPIEARRKAALENGADLAVDPAAEDFGLKLRGYTHNIGVDAVIETSANYRAIEQCLRALAYTGNMALVGWFKHNQVTLDFGHEGHFNQQNIFFSRACSEPNRDYPKWDFARICRESWKLVASGRIRCGNVVHPVVDFDECDRAYTRYIIQHPEESIKLGVKF